MEMPVDILNQRLGKIRDNGDIDFDNTAAAVDIDSELQEKFLFFPIAEIEEAANEIEENRGRVYLGTGLTLVDAAEDLDPKVILTLVENALAVYWHLKKLAEEKQINEERKRETLAKIAKRPEPGLYRAKTGRSTWFTLIVTEDRRIMVPQQLTGNSMDFTDEYDSGKVNWTDLRQISLADGTVQ